MFKQGFLFKKEDSGSVTKCHHLKMQASAKGCVQIAYTLPLKTIQDIANHFVDVNKMVINALLATGKSA